MPHGARWSARSAATPRSDEVVLTRKADKIDENPLRGVSVVLSLAWSALTGTDKTIETSTP
jgi:hypothetical protein